MRMKSWKTLAPPPSSIIGRSSSGALGASLGDLIADLEEDFFVISPFGEEEGLEELEVGGAEILVRPPATFVFMPRSLPPLIMPMLNISSSSSAVGASAGAGFSGSALRDFSGEATFLELLGEDDLDLDGGGEAGLAAGAEPFLKAFNCANKSVVLPLPKDSTGAACYKVEKRH